MNAKQAAAECAVEYIKDGMTIGLGTGSTAAFAIDAIGKKIRQGLRIRAVASSIRSEELARQNDIFLASFSDVKFLDMYIDGADEVDREMNLIKGGGGALLREKILAFNSKLFFVIVDESKLTDHLGRFLLPVEITLFAKELTIRQLQELGCTSSIRSFQNQPYLTDNGNLIIDCDFKRIENVDRLHFSINSIPGVVENGLFLNKMVHKLIVGNESGEVNVLDK